MTLRNRLSLLFVVHILGVSATSQLCHNETGRCYWMGTGSKTWEEARTACQSDGGDLAVMETEELFDFVIGSFDFCLGMSDTAQESDFHWLNNGPLYYERWDNRETDHNCAYVYVEGLADWHCWNDGPFLCSSVDIPREMWINGVEERTEVLTDGDGQSCIELSEDKSCSSFDKVVVKSEWQNKKEHVTVLMKKMPCTADYFTVMWNSVAGKYKRCAMGSMETVAAEIFTCNYVCDVTDDVAIEIKMEAKKMAIDGVAVCEVKLF